MDDDIHDTHEADQTQAKMRDFTLSLARDVVAYHGVLADSNLPDQLVTTLTEQFNAGWIECQLQLSEPGGIILNIGDDD